jgi:hypothetical protein
VDLLDFFEAQARAAASPNSVQGRLNNVEAGKGKRKTPRAEGPRGGQQADQVDQGQEGDNQGPVPAPLTWHPKVEKDLDALGKPQRTKAESLIADLAAGQRHSSTHPLHRLKGWDSTKIDSRHLIVHQHREGVLHVGYVGAQHDYDAAHRRLSTLDLESFFHLAFDESEDEPYCEHCGDWGHTDERHETTCGMCGNLKRPDGSHPYNGEGPDDRCPHAPTPVAEKEEAAYQSLDPSKYCGEGCRQGHASDIAHGVGFHHTFGIDEHDDVAKPRPDARPVPPGSSSPHSEPFARQRSGYEVRNPDDFGLCHYCRAPLKGGLADQMKSLKAEAEKAEHWKEDHAWLPKDRIFGPGKGGLDPRVFDERGIMRPAVAHDTLEDIDDLWRKYDPDWRDWARVYLAGSQASWWWGNNDFDCLIGIDHDKARAAVPAWEHKGDDEIDQMLTSELRTHLNDEDYQPPWDDQVWHRTFFVNPDSYDIRKIKPYAAYDITRHEWAVEPVHAGPDWGPTKLAEELFSEGEGLVKQINAIEGLPEPVRKGRGAALWDYLHNDRRRAFSDAGTGVFDPGNAVWKYLDMHPSQPLTRLLALKRASLESA